MQRVSWVSFAFFVVIGIVDAFHEHLAVVYLRGHTQLSVGSPQFQLGSGTNQLAVLLLQLGFQVLPIVARLGVVGFTVYGGNDIKYGEPPL